MFTASTDNHSISTPLETIHKYVNYKYSLAYIQVYRTGRSRQILPGVQNGQILQGVQDGQILQGVK